MKKILTIDDLVRFCETQRFTEFNSNKYGKRLIVSTPATYSQENQSDEYTAFGLVKMMHNGRNRNGSNVPLDSMKDAATRLAYKPLLADFCEVDGVRDFTTHAYEIDSDGNINYIEKQVGCFVNSEPTIEYDKDKDRYYLYAHTAIPREYTDAADIIERKGGSKVSVELAINEMSYDVKEKELVLEKFEILGCTLLGIDPKTHENIEEGMEGARIDIEDFFYQEPKEPLLSENAVKDFYAIFNKYKSVDENLQKGENMHANIEPNSVNEPVTMDNNTDSQTVEGTTTVVNSDNGENVVTADDDNSQENVENASIHDDNSEENSSVTPTVDDANLEYEIKFDNKIHAFKASLQDELFALTQLVNDTYSESDNAWYSVDAFADTKELTMVDYYTGKAYRQSYKVRAGKYSLVGDRVSVHARYITEDEENALEEIKKNYAEATVKLQRYEDEPKKMELLKSKDYSFIAEADDFKKLCEMENHFELSIEETKEKADSILLDAVKNTSFAKENTDSETSVKHFTTVEHKPSVTGRYGGMFDK